MDCVRQLHTTVLDQARTYPDFLPPPHAMPWDDAMSQCDQFNERPGQTRWRIPKLWELQSLTDGSQQGPALPLGHPFVQVDISLGYWTSTEIRTDMPTSWVWIVEFDTGFPLMTSKTDQLYAWCVRDCCIEPFCPSTAWMCP